MELNKESVLLQDSLIGPAFLVEDGIITQVNDAAAQRMVIVGTQVDGLISVGREEYAKYRSGKLCLQLNLGGISTGAYVTKLGSGHLFCLDSSYSMPELRVLALAAQQLRNPLGSAMINTDLLQNNPIIQEDPQAKAQLGQLSRGLHQLLRSVSNMSDASGVSLQSGNHRQCNATAVFDEVLAKAAQAVAQANHTLVFSSLKKPVHCLLDADLLERAILNLVSNATKFSPEGSTIHATLRMRENRLVFTIENAGMPTGSAPLQNTFHRFLREPGIDSYQYGIGLGMSIVLSAATAHGGTVLFNSNRNKGAKVVMTFSTDRIAPAVLESPMRLVGGYYGGLDSLLIELSDILPDSAYEIS